MSIEVEENEAKAKIEALAKKLGYSTTSFLPAQGGARLKGKYVLAFKIDNGNSPLDMWTPLMTCKQVKNICSVEDLIFEDNYWSHAVEKMEDAVKNRYSVLQSHYKVVLNPNETIDEALIRLDLSCLEK